MKRIAFVVSDDRAGTTLAAAVREAAGVSHSIAKGMVDAGMVKLEGRVVTQPARRLRAGQSVEALFEPGTRYRQREAPRQASGYRVLMEDPDLLVVEKDPGLLTVPAPSRPLDSLADRILVEHNARGLKAPRLWVVHRIDRFTSGLVLFARTERAAAELMDQFRRRTPRREYLAICEGSLRPDRGRLASRLVEDPRSLKVRETDDPRVGYPASCSYVVEARLTGACLVRVALETGRRNQIRVQLAAVGHPLLGDRAYGHESSLIGRVALHAARLGFTHPSTGRPVSLESPMPADMRRALRRLGRSGESGPRSSSPP